jgi:cytochrome c-type biogenesis protein CcmH
MLFALAFAILMQTAPGTENAPAATTSTAPYDSALEARVKDVSSTLRCPVCQGLSIQDSPSELSLQMKDVVRQMLREGKSPKEIKAYFVSKYGEWILLEPKASGMNIIVYGLPVLLVVLGAAFIYFIVKKWSAAGGSVAAAASVDEEEELPV